MTNEKQGAGCLKGIFVGLIVILVGVGLIFGGFALYEKVKPRPPVRVVRQPTDVELFVENSPRWDAERLKNLKWIVSNSGRCDDVRIAVRDQTSTIPVWRVHCLGAYSYEVTFDDSGEVVKVRPF